VKESIARSCILAGLRETIASPAVLAYARRRIAERLGEMTRTADTEARALRSRLSKVESRIEKLTDAIANGAALESVLSRLASEEGEAKGLRAQLTEVEAVRRTPLRLPSPDGVLEAVLDLNARLAADVEAGREAIRRLLRGGTIRLRPTPERVYVAEADVLPLALFLAPDVRTPASGDRDGRYTTEICGGLHRRLSIVIPLTEPFEVRLDRAA
jgi:hypothetical protein